MSTLQRDVDEPPLTEQEESLLTMLIRDAEVANINPNCDDVGNVASGLSSSRHGGPSGANETAAVSNASLSSAQMPVDDSTVVEARYGQVEQSAVSAILSSLSV